MSEVARADRWLVFVDTSVLLSVYESPRPCIFENLRELASLLDHVVTTGQVRDEFLRSRHRVMSRPQEEWRRKHTKLVVPSYLRNLPEGEAAEKTWVQYQLALAALDAAIAQEKEAPRRDEVIALVRALLDTPRPARLPPDDQAAERCFARAQRRSRLGNPPGKADAYGMGDAYNWEWCLEICEQEHASLLVVTLDSDHSSALVERDYVPNMLLEDELRRRVGPDRALRVTQRLTAALAILGRSVPPARIEEETIALGEIRPSRES